MDIVYIACIYFGGIIPKKQFRIFKEEVDLLFSTLRNLSRACRDALIVFEVLAGCISSLSDEWIESSRLKPLYPTENDEKLLIQTSASCNCFISASFEKCFISRVFGI